MPLPLLPSPLKAGPGEGWVGEGDPRPLPAGLCAPCLGPGSVGGVQALPPMAMFKAVPVRSPGPAFISVVSPTPRDHAGVSSPLPTHTPGSLPPPVPEGHMTGKISCPAPAPQLPMEEGSRCA